MEESQKRPVQDDEIDLLSLFGVLWRRKKMIIGLSVLVACLAVGFSILSLLLEPEKSFLPNMYAPRALMLINDAKSSGGQLSSMLNATGLGGLIGLSSSEGAKYSDLAVYLAKTNHFLDSIVDEFSLIDRYNIKKHPRTSSRKTLRKYIKAEIDKESGVYSLSFEDYDPIFAQKVVDFATEYMEKRFADLGIDQNLIQKENLEQNIENTYEEIRHLEKEAHTLEFSVSSAGFGQKVPSIMLDMARIEREIEAQEKVYTELKIEYELLRVKLASETPVFQILERAEVPDRKSSPSRGLICIIATFVAFFFAVLLAFVFDAIEGIRDDADAMERLFGRKKVKN